MIVKSVHSLGTNSLFVDHERIYATTISYRFTKNHGLLILQSYEKGAEGLPPSTPFSYHNMKRRISTVLDDDI